MFIDPLNCKLWGKAISYELKEYKSHRRV